MLTGIISSNVQFLKRNPFYHNPRLSPVNISKCCEQVCCKICMQKGSLLSTDFQSQCLVSSSSSSLPPAPWPVSPCPPPTESPARLAGSRSRSRVGATASAPQRGATPRRGAPPLSTSTAPTRPPDTVCMMWLKFCHEPTNEQGDSRSRMWMVVV